MRALEIVFPKPRTVELVRTELPPVGAGQVLTKNLASLISTGTESWCYRGEFDEGSGWARWVQFPFRPGYSMVGEVVAVGDEVTDYAVGDRVCHSGRHAQYTLLSASSVTSHVADGVATEDAAWSNLSATTQTGVRRAGLTFGGRVVVIGVGLLGQLAVQWLRAAGMLEILAIDTSPLRLEAAARHGATHCFQGTAAEAVDFVAEHTEGNLADAVFDVTGQWVVLPLALKLARNFGSVILLGDTPTPSKQVLTHDVMTRGVNIIGTHTTKLSGDDAFWTMPRQVQLFHEFLRRGTMQVSDLNTHRFSPLEAPEVYEMLQTDRRAEVLGVLFDWSQVPAEG